MTRLAAVDCGTNSIRLLICDSTDGKIKEIHRTMEIVRLGEGVDETGHFSDAALARTANALEGYATIMDIERVNKVRMVATSASRDAANKDEFFAMTAELLGRVVPGAQAEIISGEEEAALSFKGAVFRLGKEPFRVHFRRLVLGQPRFCAAFGRRRFFGITAAAEQRRRHQAGCSRSAVFL